MKHCTICGEESMWDTYCHKHRVAWAERRDRVFKQAQTEIGPLGPDTLAAIQKRVKQLEKIEPLS